MENIQEEIKEFDKLIKKYPDIRELYIGRAILYSKIGEYEKAVKDYKRGCENYLCYDRMNIFRRNNLIKEAEELYTKKINKDENNIINYMSRMRFYVSIGEDKKALADCESILKISPANKLVLEYKKALTEKLKEQNKRTNILKTRPVFR